MFAVAVAMKWIDEPVVCGHFEIKHLMRAHSHPIETSEQMNERKKNFLYMRLGTQIHFTIQFKFNFTSFGQQANIN